MAEIHHPDRRRHGRLADPCGSATARRSKPRRNEHGLHGGQPGGVGMVRSYRRRCPGKRVSNAEHPRVRPRRRLHRHARAEAASIGISLGPTTSRAATWWVEERRGRLRDGDSLRGTSHSEAAELLASLQEASSTRGSVPHGRVVSPPDDLARGFDGVRRPSARHPREEDHPLPPPGGRREFLLTIMEISREVFSDHPVNRKRAASGKLPGNSVWLLGAGKAPRIRRRGEVGLTGIVGRRRWTLIKGSGSTPGAQVVAGLLGTGYNRHELPGKAEHALASSSGRTSS